MAGVFVRRKLTKWPARRGFGSDPELPLGEAAEAKSGDAAGNDVFNFRLESDDSDEVPLGKEPVPTEKPSSRSGAGFLDKRLQIAAAQSVQR